MSIKHLIRVLYSRASHHLKADNVRDSIWRSTCTKPKTTHTGPRPARAAKDSQHIHQTCRRTQSLELVQAHQTASVSASFASSGFSHERTTNKAAPGTTKERHIAIDLALGRSLLYMVSTDRGIATCNHIERRNARFQQMASYVTMNKATWSI